MLYIIENNLTKEAINQLTKPLTKDDCVLLINEGVYLAPWFAQSQNPACFYVLIDHAIQRGVVINNAQGINSAQMVDLTAMHSPCITY